MKGTPYPLKKEENLIFSFISKGPKGDIEKIIRYDKLFDDYFNLGFGDRILKTLFFRDDIVTDNKDTRTVMTTVIQTLPLFFSIHPNKKVYFQGSDQRRTDFYGWIIKNNYDDLKDDFYIYGMTEIGLEEFVGNMSYQHFVISKK